MTIHIKDSTRLSYRPMNLDEGHLMYELDNDELVMKYITNGKVTSMMEINQIYIPRLTQYRNLDKGWGLWNCFIKQTDKYLGWILVRPINFFTQQPNWRDIELGWRLKRNFWGQGYATEAAGHIMSALSATPNIDRFTAMAVQQNLQSIQVMKKLGMTFLKTDLLHDSDFGDQLVDYYVKEND